MIYRALSLIIPDTVKLSYYCRYETPEQINQHKEPKVIFAVFGGGH